MTNDEVMDIFKYHPPMDDQVAKYTLLGSEFRDLAVLLNDVLPDGPGKTVAIRKLAEARMQANACVALDGRF